MSTRVIPVSRPLRAFRGVLAFLLIGSGLSVISIDPAQAIGTGICESTLASPSGISSTVTESGSDCIVRLTVTTETTSGSGTWTVPAGVTQIQYLVVAGGGGGAGGQASEHGGGGGGAGGLLAGTLNLSTSTLSVSVGSAGSGGAAGARGTSGSNSSLGTGITAVGGGAGGTYFTDGPLSGGSGGGAGAGNNRTVTSNATSGQGNSGGSVTRATTSGRHGGGGGGAGGAGGSTTDNGTITTSAGAGGIGIQSSITGTSVTYAGGGGGGGSSKDAGSTGGGAGGSGIGGTGATWTGSVTTQATAGTASTGSGGGGGIGTGGGSSSVGSNGGSGVVVIKYSAGVTVTATGTSPGICDQFVNVSTGVTAVRLSGGDCVVKFTSTAASTMWRVPTGVTSVRVLIVGGGGGGGAWVGAGGGGGGFREINSVDVSGVSAVSVNVGAGGIGATWTNPPVAATSGSAGGVSSFLSYESAGGGKGAGHPPGSNFSDVDPWNLVKPTSGGSGGGGTGAQATNATIQLWTDGANGTAGQGNNGGNGLIHSQAGDTWVAGGGGGAGGAGGAGTTEAGGAGGVGRSSDITGEETFYAGGGGGAHFTTPSLSGLGGNGGGGNAARTSSPTNLNGTASSGGGGGGGNGNGDHAGARNGGNGGSGVVVIRYSVTVTATFNSNYGTPTTTTQSIPPSISTALTANTFSRSGFTFVGWNTNADGSGTDYGNGTNVAFTSSQTLYALWTEIVTDSLKVNLDASRGASLQSGSTTWTSVLPGSASISPSTINGVTRDTTGGITSLKFDGTSDYLVYPDSSNTNNQNSPYTVETWVKFTSLDLVNWNIFATKWFDNATRSDSTSAQEWHFGILGAKLNLYANAAASGCANVTYNEKTFTSGDINKWFHFAFKVDGSGIGKIYINGIPSANVGTNRGPNVG
jgi:uncharacterized repeat protein (TIGR02543 family)